MLFKQSKNSFIRSTEKYGYVTNQLTKFDRVYNSTGAEFLRMISRDPRSIEDAIEHLLSIFESVTKEELTQDFLEFITDLSIHKFVIVGETVEELETQDLDFSYAHNNPKTLTNNYYQETEQQVGMSTQDYFLEEVQGTPKISSLQFELSSRCNERCIHCYIPNEKKNHGFDMPTTKVKSILDEFAAMGGLHVTLSGGEAFMHKDLLEIVMYCREKDLSISILSNLISLKDDDIPVLKKANVSLIQTSLYAVEPEIHDAITTVPGSCEKTKAAIEKLVAADIPVQISCPVMKTNKDAYINVLKYARERQIKAQTDYIMMARADFSTDNLEQRLSYEETETLLRGIIEHDIEFRKETLKKIPKSELMILDFEAFKKQPLCGVGYDNCCITANGDVYPCAGWQNYVLGNVYKQSLKDIWENNEKIKELRTITESSFPQCLECEAFDFCARCLVRNFNESNGDMFKINPVFCEEAFLLKRLAEEYHNKGVIDSPFFEKKNC